MYFNNNLRTENIKKRSSSYHSFTGCFYLSRNAKAWIYGFIGRRSNIHNTRVRIEVKLALIQKCYDQLPVIE